MSRPKSLVAAQVSNSAKDLLALLREAVQDCEDEFGDPIDSEGYHPLQVLARFSINPNVKDELRIRCADILSRYLEPQLKALEVHSNVDHELIIVHKYANGDPIPEGNNVVLIKDDSYTDGPTERNVTPTDNISAYGPTYSAPYQRERPREEPTASAQAQSVFTMADARQAALGLYPPKVDRVVRAADDDEIF
ncbi:MAG TPA: hypothetical protein VMS08_01115 [Candidatus Saccharimonadia bacterium]|nr:hypothetical protein [Candidatus Saccharimonadia bacterium]